MRDEVLPPTTGHGSFSDSVIDLASMETVPAELMPSETAAPAEDPRKRVDALRAGDRLRLFLHGRWSRVQLLWRSDRSLFFLFAGESPSRTHSITRRALERLSSAGLVQPLEARPLVQRALDAVMRDAGRVNGLIAPAEPARCCSISAAMNAGRSWTIQCVAPGTRTRRMCGHERLEAVEQRDRQRDVVFGPDHERRQLHGDELGRELDLHHRVVRPRSAAAAATRGSSCSRRSGRRPRPRGTGRAPARSASRRRRAPGRPRPCW